MKNLLVLVLLLVGGCNSVEQPKSGAGRIDSCRYIGNEASSRFCRISFQQILARPEAYEGRLVIFQGWVVKNDQFFVVFPTRDALDGGEITTSVLVGSGPALSDLSLAFSSLPPETPRRLYVGGRLKVHSPDEGEMRFGELQEFQIADP